MNNISLNSKLIKKKRARSLAHRGTRIQNQPLTIIKLELMESRSVTEQSQIRIFDFIFPFDMSKINETAMFGINNDLSIISNQSYIKTAYKLERFQKSQTFIWSIEEKMPFKGLWDLYHNFEDFIDKLKAEKSKVYTTMADSIERYVLYMGTDIFFSNVQSIRHILFSDFYL